MINIKALFLAIYDFIGHLLFGIICIILFALLFFYIGLFVINFAVNILKIFITIEPSNLHKIIIFIIGFYAVLAPYLFIFLPINHFYKKRIKRNGKS